MKRRLAIACALGLLTTLAVAVVLGATGVYGDDRASRFGARLRDSAAGEGDGELRARAFRGCGRVILETAARRKYTELTGDAPPEPVVPAWARAEALPWLAGRALWPAVGQADARAVRATGWPFVALFHHYTWRKNPALNYGGEYITPGGLRVEPSNGTPGAWPITYPRAIPLRPVWGGLVADSAIYALAWLVTLSLVSFCCRRVRRRAGRCPSCGYDLGGLTAASVCPECGRSPYDQP